MKRHTTTIFIVSLCWLAGCGQPAPHTGDPAIALQINAGGDRPEIAVASRAELWTKQLDWRDVLTLRLVNKGTPAPTPLLGTYNVDGRRLVFRPQFGLIPGQEYEAAFNSEKLGPTLAASKTPLTQRFTAPQPAGINAPVVEALYPTADKLPANHLKFYVVFSRPMFQGGIFKYLKVLNAQGEEVPEPFRETELWSDDGLRLTLWFHPGRQKTGVNLNVEIGPILEPGGKYTLVIDGALPAQGGGTLGRAYHKEFTAGPADYAQPDVAAWTLVVPSAGARSELRVKFPESLDWAVLLSRLKVSRAGIQIAGDCGTTDSETVWWFKPAQAWRAGDYSLIVPAVLEDLAGNSLERPFEVNLETAPATTKPAEVVLPFTVKP